uniref:EGF-like domain-containing protein n=1 Tax=Strongyloides papillosus TaxID=174720 RepID=A0A0N5C9N0_STREA
MLVKFLPLLLIISKDISSYFQNGDYESIVVQENNCPATLLAEQKIITIRFNTLKKFDTKQREYENIKFKEIKILHLEWDEIKSIASHGELCGLTVGTDDTSIRNYNITYSTGYYVGHNFDNIEQPIYCNIQQCDLGLVFFDKFKNAETLNNLKKNHTVEHAVLMVVKSSDNKMLLGVRSHHKVNIILGLCPYINWVQKKGILKFVPEDYIRDNGYFEEGNSFAHIVLPFYKKNQESDEFICGKLKQPTMPDLLIGFKLREDNEDKKISEDINPLEDELKCNSGDAIGKHCHFGYLEKDTNYMSERIMEPIRVHKKESLKYHFYAGQKIYIYFYETISKALENASKHLRLKIPYITERVLCIRNLKKGIKANILPSIGSVDSIKKNERLNIFYRLVQLDDLNKKYPFRCLSKVNGKNKAHMEEFYSRTAKFSIKSEEDPNIIYTSSNNEIAFIDKEIQNYGSYRCKESDAISLFDKNYITMDKVYYLPYEGAEMKFVESHVDDTYQSDIGCNKQYGTFGVIKKITIKFGQDVNDPITIEDFSNSTDTIYIKEGKIIYKPPKGVLGVTVECTYTTPAETTFYTRKDTFIAKSQDTGTKNETAKTITKEKVVTQVKNNSTPWVIGIVIAVILFCIIVIVVAYLIVRRVRKRRAEDSLSSYSGLTTLSKSRNKGSTSMNSSKSRTRGGSRSASMSNASRTAKSGKGSRTATRSSNVTSNVS